MKRSIVLSSLTLTLYACSFGDTRTLGDLQYKPEKEKQIEFERLSHQEVREEYQELLGLFKDEEVKEQIERRIADVYMIEGGRKQVAQQETKSYYVEAIKGYHDILKKYPNSPDNADVLYQLARAYELDGHQDKALEMLLQLTTRHPNYKNNAEAHFRMGDIYFNQQAYRKAQKEYLTVARMPDPKLHTYAHYMLGWTYYKQLNFTASLNAFALVLNQLLDGTAEAPAELDNAQASLVNDTIHSMSLGLAKNGGAQALEKIASLQGKPYLWRIYDDLGDYFLEKERFEDSAETFRHYVQRYNFSAQAPDMHGKLIETYVKGGFPLQALKEKEVYVDYYGIDSNYASVNNGVPDRVKKALKIYFDELAEHYHGKAQVTLKLYEKTSQQKNRKMSDKKLAAMKADFVTSFQRAAHFYSQYIATFPRDARVPEMTFLKAEAYLSAGQHPQAIEEFERVAYQLDDFKDAQYRARAGYAAIASYQDHIDGLGLQQQDQSENRKSWQAKAVESMLRFAEVFHTDKRSPSVLTNAAEYLFGLEQYQRAVDVSQKLIDNNPDLDRELKKTAYGIVAHSYYKLEQFQLAEVNYTRQRNLIGKQSEEYKQVSERLANAIYRNSETLVAADDKDQAITELLKIKALTPGSKVRVAAQYNAATLLLATEQWDRAVDELRQLAGQYPQHELAFEFPRKLALAYEKRQSWKSAGDTYLALSKKDKDPEVRRNALFLAAEMYEKNKSYDISIELFKQYARAYEQPFDVRMEARYRLANLYETTGDPAKQLFWLRRIIDGDRTGGKQRTDRSRWLGAWANIKYGDHFATEFRRKKLTRALAKSLAKKNEALKNAVARYEQAADYGLFEFVTMSSYKTAQLYQQLAFALRNAPRPKGLSAEERQIYTEVIEEQAMPLDQLAVDLHIGNLQRAWDGEFDQWIDKSFAAMRVLAPARFDKQELQVSYGDEIR
ncbi:tetratricopeptide repeat protein [Exilibacterium tricleocarpae]|uniref:Tetratricopeptide repeat protein n=1 Tax=Exilibacterium tricleocarpae TaxID=2591008 RepID=A0A545TAH0_9GAMM|nr:tetratricopeptide repeat protein [Exilibacterium tricleocarpae]TQV74210.1 tetratricopeptide repeat protein [Exilibacterium tricleocarpae]